MNLFDQLVQEALAADPQLNTLQPVVEKEILHQDILREMNSAGLLSELTFIGGTCLRDCYGSPRLSEDLDFTGGTGFERRTLSDLGKVLVDSLQKKYGLTVQVSDPVKEIGNVDTWKLKMITRPEHSHMPAQRINIDICSLPSYDKKPAMLMNHYNIEMGTSGIILFAESLEEILADKMIAFALRPNRVKNRDLWDIDWMTRRGISLEPDLITKKIADRKIESEKFQALFAERILTVENGQSDFLFELIRFLPVSSVQQGMERKEYWVYLISVLREAEKKLA